MAEIISSLRWRYAVKAFSPQKIPTDTFSTLLESLVLTASSYGLQPWKFLVIKNPEIRAKLKDVSWGQSQVVDASDLIVLTARTDIDAAYIESYISDIAKTRGVSAESLEGYKKMMLGGIIDGMSTEARTEWAKKQCYIALGNLLTVAAELHIDACPMEGFVPSEYDKILGLTEKGLTSVLVCPVGYRSENDAYAQAAKVRFSKEELIETIN